MAAYVGSCVRSLALIFLLVLLAPFFLMLLLFSALLRKDKALISQ